MMIAEAASPSDDDKGHDNGEPMAIDPAVGVQMAGVERDNREQLGKVRAIPGLHADENLSSELRAEVDEFNTRRTACIDRFQKLVEPLLATLSRLGRPHTENPSLGEVFAEVDMVKMSRVVELEEAAALAATGQELASQCAEELAPVAKRLEEDFNDVVEVVKADLTHIGQGIETTIAGAKGFSGDVADRQFHFLATTNVRSRKAFVTAHDARNRANAAKDAEWRCKDSAEKIRTTLTHLVAAEIRV